MSIDGDVFTDKIKVTISYLEKRNELSNQYHTVINDLNAGFIDYERLNEYPAFLWACQNFAELYGSILRYTYAVALDKKERDEVEQIYIKYITGGISLKQLSRAYQLTIKIMALNKFDDVIIKPKGLKGLKRIEAKYKLNGESNN